MTPTLPTPPDSSASGTLTGVSVRAASNSLTLGQMVPLTATAMFSNATTQNVTNQATWTSSNLMVAQVSSGGVVTGLSTGSADIQATYQDQSARITLSVTIEGRSSTDRPDDIGGYQVRVMYVLPSDGIDQGLDVNGALALSVSAFQNWLQQQSGGQRLRIDTFGGSLDIGFVRLQDSNAQMSSAGVFLRDRIEADLRLAGFSAFNKIYAVYFGGGTAQTPACGGGPWPPNLVGHVSALYLFGQPAGAPPCSNNRFASSDTAPGYLEYSMLHEIFHAVGVVPSCAPNITMGGHVSDSPSDLMYAGSLPWTPSMLDIGHDDYFKTGSADCLDVSKSVFLGGAVPPPGW